MDIDQWIEPENENRKNTVTVLVPTHVSHEVPVDSTTFILHIYKCHGIAWREIVPMMFDAPQKVTRMLLKILWQQSEIQFAASLLQSNGENTSHSQEKTPKEEKSFDGLRCRKIRVYDLPSITIVVQPPTSPHRDSTFASVVIGTELSLLRRQTLTAWWATLGGGYFFCRRLHISLRLARQQRDLALEIGNISMARQCSINEAYNLIYAGKFKAAKAVLTDLEHSLHDKAGTDSVTFRQCQAARLLAKRLKQVARRGLESYHTIERGEKHAVDDFQRIRIVQD